MEDVSEMLPFNQMLRTRVAFHSDSSALPVARIEGVTSAGIFMNGGVITGEVALMNLEGWTWEENAVRPVAGLGLSFPGGGGGGRGGGGGGRGGGGGGGGSSLQDLEKLLDEARLYAKNPNRDMNWALEPLVPIVLKKQPFYTQAGNEGAVQSAIAWAERQGLNLVIRTSPATAVATADLLKAKNVPVILSTVLSMPTGNEDVFHAATYQAAGKLADAGVTFAFSSGGFETSRLIAFQAAMSVAWGLDRNEAIKALTINAARILGADNSLGSIEAGKIANLIVVNGDPLEIRSRIQHVVIGGHDVPLVSRQTEQFIRYMGRQ
jgi:hypothetical protein